MNRQRVLEEIEDKVVAELKELTQKDSISVAELEAMTKATCLLEKIDMLKENEMYSMSMDYDRYPMARGRSYARGGEESYTRGGEESYERGRYSRTGRSMSRENGYSGHSIKDRMIDRLEQMVDEAKTDHERQVIETWIDRLSSEQY
jgi:hypothetical protein